MARVFAGLTLGSFIDELMKVDEKQKLEMFLKKLDEDAKKNNY